MSVGAGVEFDPLRRMPGRGVYLHSGLDCWTKVRDAGRWEHALRLDKGALAGQKFVEFFRELGAELGKQVG